MATGKSKELEKLILHAKTKGEEYFRLLQTPGLYEFERVEQARRAAIQAVKDAQQFADLNRLSGAGSTVSVPPGVDVEVEKLRKNVETVQRLTRTVS